MMNKEQLEAERAAEQKRQELAGELVGRDVYACQSYLVDSMLKVTAESNPGDLPTFDDIEGLYPTPDGWTLEQCKDWLDEYGIGHPDPDPWAMSTDELAELVEGLDEQKTVTVEDIADLITDETIDGIDAWRDAIRDNAEPAEIFEWWLVSDWLAERLSEKGQPTLEYSGNHWWGRCTTGQAILLDGVIQEIASV